MEEEEAEDVLKLLCGGSEILEQNKNNNVSSVLTECNCHGKAQECFFNQTVADLSLSLDIHGERRGGGVCVRCQDNTAGVNCESCTSGFFRPAEVCHT